ncbi:MAG: glycosyltransferase family 4 protein [Geminicoccaceae bacterium]
MGVERAITGCPGTRPIDIVHVSGFARKIAEPFLTEAGRHFVVANPIDMARKPAVNVRGNQEFLFLGRLTPEKEPVLFAKAAAIAGVAATFLGTGPEETAIRAAYPEARLLGWGQRSDVEQALSRARGLVFPSLWNETSGLVVAEAIARGVPAIVSRATAAHELIDDGMTGFRFDPGDLEGLVSAIRRLGDDDVAEQMGVNAFEAYWRDPPTRAAHASKLLEIYDFIIRDMTPEHREATDENNLRV